MDGKAIVASIIVGILGLYSTVVGLIFVLMPPETQVSFSKHSFQVPTLIRSDYQCIIRVYG